MAAKLLPSSRTSACSPPNRSRRYWTSCDRCSCLQKFLGETRRCPARTFPRRNMRSGFLRFFVIVTLTAPLLASGQSVPRNGGDFSNNTQPAPEAKVPTGVILVKGAWASASDNVTPLPEGGSVINNVYRNQYFGLTYALPKDWIEKYKGPPPSDSGRYVLAQLRPADTFKGPALGTVLITAQDMFFTPIPATNVLQFVTYLKDNLQADYQVELAPAQTR